MNGMVACVCAVAKLEMRDTTGPQTARNVQDAKRPDGTPTNGRDASVNCAVRFVTMGMIGAKTARSVQRAQQSDKTRIHGTDVSALHAVRHAMKGMTGARTVRNAQSAARHVTAPTIGARNAKDAQYAVRPGRTAIAGTAVSVSYAERTVTKAMVGGTGLEPAESAGRRGIGSISMEPPTTIPTKPARIRPGIPASPRLSFSMPNK
jgi:hypothetical protein